MPLNLLLGLQVYNCSCWCVDAVSDDVIFDLQVQVCGIVSNDVIFVSHLYTWKNYILTLKGMQDG